MPHRTDSVSLAQSFFRHGEDQAHSSLLQHHIHPSPHPPIATLPQSPSLSSSSLDRSSVDSPAPSGRTGSNLGMYSSSHYYDPESERNSRMYYPANGIPASHDLYHPPADMHRYSPHSHAQAHIPPHQVYSAPPSHVVPSQISAPSAGFGVGPLHSAVHPFNGGVGNGQQNYSIVYTDDASTKLSDRVRRKCYNCTTTDTSTWRRSSLNPGKVLCNKCGLFERTHSRPRPDQFPHKRGPLSGSSLRVLPPSSPQHPNHPSQGHHATHTFSPTQQSRHSPPRPTLPPTHALTNSPPSHSSHHLPSISSVPPSSSQYSHPSIPSLLSSGPGSGSNSPHYRNRSVSDSAGVGTTLPQIHSWLDEPASNSSSAGGPDRHGRFRSNTVRESGSSTVADRERFVGAAGRDHHLDAATRERYSGASPTSRSRQIAVAAPVSVRTRSP